MYNPLKEMKKRKRKEILNEIGACVAFAIVLALIFILGAII